MKFLLLINQIKCIYFDGSKKNLWEMPVNLTNDLQIRELFPNQKSCLIY